MEEESEDRESREALSSSDSGIVRRTSGRAVKSRGRGQYCDDVDIDIEDESMYAAKKSRKTSLNLTSDGHDSRLSKSYNAEGHVNHLNALANLDPSSKFLENSSLIQDIRFAANAAAAEEEVNKVYMCHLCDFKTAYSNSLMNHQAVHSDFRPWACTACEYAAKRKQDLKKHLQTVHGMMVESPMLKPLVPGGTVDEKFHGNVDGSKDHFVDSLNLKRASSVDQEFSSLQPSSSTQGQPSAKRIKDEAPHSPDMSSKDPNALPGGDLDSPDENLPISFPALSSSSGKRSDVSSNLQTPPSIPKFLPGKEEGEIVFNGAHPNFAWHLNNRRELFSDSAVNNIPRDWANHSIKKENNPHEIMFASKNDRHQPVPVNKLHTLSLRENSFHRSFSLSDDDTRNSEDHGMATLSETERSITSSSLVGQVRSTQTPSGFLCEHCDILFFQRAMYVMHIGLHAPDNPWCCSVCGNTFTEKYSFTSHFINQH